MKYKINNIESRTTSAGKPYASANLTDEAGLEQDRVGIWDNFNTLKAGDVIEGEVVQNGNFKNFRFPKAAGGFSPAAAQAKKAEFIKEAQANKEEGIKTAATFKAATEITLAIMEKQGTWTELEFNSKWLSVRKWLIENYEHDGNSIPF